MIFKHNKNISRNFIVFYCLVFFLFSCGGGGGSGNNSSIAQPNPLTFSVSSLPSSVESYDLTSLQVDSNKKHGYSADETLKLIQGLYEKKLVT